MHSKFCPFCNNSATSKSADKILCPACGPYTISDEALDDLPSYKLSPRQLRNISSFLYENPNSTIVSASFEKLKALQTPSVLERIDKLLLRIEKETTRADSEIETTPLWHSASWSEDDRELKYLVYLLRDMKRIEIPSGAIGVKTKCRITIEGWRHIEEIKRKSPDSQQCFVAMWFDHAMTVVYDKAIAPGILAAGFRPHLVSQREHTDKIDDEIIAQIRKSRFVLADFTGQRGGVYYEAGFAKGLSLEVIWTCRQDDIVNLHFDIRQFNCIEWELSELDAFTARITNRILSVIGEGSYRT